MKHTDFTLYHRLSTSRLSENSQDHLPENTRKQSDSGSRAFFRISLHIPAVWIKLLDCGDPGGIVGH